MLIDDIHAGESEQLEFKETPNRDSGRWLKTAVAFANCRGGRIIFGVSNDRRIIGVHGDVFAMRDSISDALSNACEPMISVDISMTTLEGKQLIVLEIPEGRQTPYYLKSQGEVAGVYVRYDATTRVADEMSLKELRINGSARGFDALECRGMKITSDDIMGLCRNMYTYALDNALTDEIRRMVRPVTPAQLVKWGVLLEKNNQYFGSNAYTLLSGNAVFRPVVKCAVFKGTSRAVFVDRKEFYGAIQYQVEETYKYVLSKINMSSVFGNNVRRQDVYEIPPSALREIIVNAVVHRSYVNGEESPITVALYDDRLEVTSPGKLPHGVTTAKMFEGCSECRNKVLAQAFAYMNIIENWGSGIPRICEALQEAGLPKLNILAWPNAVRYIVYRRIESKVDIENNNVDIRGRKVDIGGGKIDFEIRENVDARYVIRVSSKLRKHIVDIKRELGGLPYFRRSNVNGVLTMSNTGASKLLSKLIDLHIIEPVQGHGKGAYRFVDIEV